MSLITLTEEEKTQLWACLNSGKLNFVELSDRLQDRMGLGFVRDLTEIKGFPYIALEPRDKICLLNSLRWGEFDPEAFTRGTGVGSTYWLSGIGINQLDQFKEINDVTD